MPLGFEKLSLRGEKPNINGREKQENAPPAAPPKDAPPSYTANDPVDEPSVAELNAAFTNLNLSDTPPEFPKADYCLAHLKLLNAFHALKEDIGYTDGIFGLWDAKCEVLEGTQRDKALAKTREKRWALFVARAVERFEDWWLKVLCSREGVSRLEGKYILSEDKDFSKFPQRGRIQKWTIDMLPPLGTF